MRIGKRKRLKKRVRERKLSLTQLAMPVFLVSEEAHREKDTETPLMGLAMISRMVSMSEVMKNTKAKVALDGEWTNLVTKPAWAQEKVEEWGTVSARARKAGKKVHVGRVHELCTEKGSQSSEGRSGE